MRDATIPSITAIRLVLTQTTDTVSGDVDFNGAWNLGVRGTVRGGRLTLTGTGNIASQGLTFAIESWDSTLSGNSMPGDFAMRFYPTSGSPSGQALYKVNMVGTTRQ